MKSAKVTVSKKKIHEYAGELLVAFIAQRKESLTGEELLQPLLESLGQYKEFSGKAEEHILLYPPLGSMALSCRRLLLVGLGKFEAITDVGERNEALRVAGGIAAAQCRAHKIDELAFLPPSCAKKEQAGAIEYLTEGILLGDYSFQKYKTEKKEEDIETGLKEIDILTQNTGAIRDAIARSCNSANAVRAARDMANEPGNGWTSSHFADYASELAARLQIHCTVLDKSAMAELGMGGIIAVNQGSETPPKLVILEYDPRRKSAETVLLVGKGLTFDSGGISLKPAQGMMDMKYDMCGGAVVLAAMEAVALEKPDVRVVAMVPATDNMAGGGALKPGDVIVHYGGKTSEIENTDAEGRLIIADALAYGIEKFQPNCVIDIATLTGAVVVALGHHHAGLLSNNDILAERIIAAGNSSGEPYWRLPMGEAYRKQIKSTIADMKNTGGKHAGAITAAEYLRQFVGKVPWAHLDIAGTAWEFTEKSYIPKGPSGFGVRTLITVLRQWQNGSFPRGGKTGKKKSS
jgi:leucyl aminopeptidase